MVPDRQAEDVLLGGEGEAEAAHVVREVLFLDQLARHLYRVGFQAKGFVFVFGFRVMGVWCTVCGVGCMVYGVRCSVYGAWCGLYGVVREVLLLDQLACHLFQGLGFRFSVSGFGSRVSGFG